MRAIALDPGGSTGWAYVTDASGQLRYRTGTLTDDQHHLQLSQLLGNRVWHSSDPSFVICEGFEYRNRSRPGLELVSKEYIGVAKLFCQQSNVPYKEQTAAMGKGFVRDANIKRLGLWKTGADERHCMDAMRHLLFWLINTHTEHANELLIAGWK